MYSKQFVKLKKFNSIIFIMSLLLGFTLTGCAIHSEQAQYPEAHKNSDDDTGVSSVSGSTIPATKKSNTDQEKLSSEQVNAGQPEQELTPELLYDLMLAEIALQRKDYTLAFDKYYKAARQTKDSRLAKKATRVTLFSKDDTQTFKAVKLWSELEPDNSDVQQIYASSLISQKQDELALLSLQKVINLSDTFEQGFKRAYAILETVEEHGRANSLFVRLAESYKNKPVVMLYQAKLAFKFVDYPATEKHLNRLLAIKPGYLDALVLKVELLKKQKRDIQAIQILEKVLHKLPENTALRLELARLLIKNKNYEQGLKQVEQLAKKELAPEVLFAISLLAIEMDQLDEAKQYLERLHQHRLYASESAYFIAQLEAGRENYGEAEDWFKRVRNGKYTFEAYLGLVMVYSQQKKFEQAFKLLEHSSANNDKQSTEILQIKAEVYAQARDYTKAYEIYTQAVNLAPDNHDIRYGRAMLAEKFGRIDLLEKDLHTILAENPKDNQALNALGYTLADRTNRYQEALQYIERALAINSEDVATLDSMGWVLYKMGKHNEALKYLQRAYDKDPDPEIAAHYGEILWVSGQTAKARVIWDKALKVDPEHRVLIGTRTRYLK